MFYFFCGARLDVLLFPLCLANLSSLRRTSFQPALWIGCLLLLFSYVFLCFVRFCDKDFSSKRNQRSLKTSVASIKIYSLSRLRKNSWTACQPTLQTRRRPANRFQTLVPVFQYLKTNLRTFSHIDCHARVGCETQNATLVEQTCLKRLQQGLTRTWRACCSQVSMNLATPCTIAETTLLLGDRFLR